MRTWGSMRATRCVAQGAGVHSNPLMILAGGGVIVLQQPRPEMVTGADAHCLVRRPTAPTSGAGSVSRGATTRGGRRHARGLRCRYRRSRALPLPPARDRRELHVLVSGRDGAHTDAARNAVRALERV
jgi:hypothetical protein